jgi:hypothetical protein
MHEQLDQQDAANSAAEVANTALGGAKQVIAAQQESWKAATDSSVAAGRVAYGADPTKIGSESNYWLGEMQANAHKAYTAMDAVKAGQSKTLLNDPLGYIQAQFSLPADIDTFNYYAQKHNIAEESLNQTIAASDANVIATKRAEQTTSTEVAIAKGQEATQTAAYNLAQLQSKSAGERIKGLQELNAMSAQQASYALQAHQAANSDKSLALQAQAHADAQADRQIRIAQMQELMDQKTQKVDDLNYYTSAYNAGAKRVGKSEISADMFRRLAQQKSPEFQDIFAQGQQLLANDNGVSNGISVAGSAGHAAAIYASGGVQLTPGTVQSYLYDSYEKAKMDPAAPKDREAFVAGVGATAVSNAVKLEGKIDPKVGNNIYSAPPTASVMQAAGTATDPFLAAVVKPLVDQDPNIKIPDDVMFGKAFDFAAKSKDLNAAAAGVSAYYTQAVLKNNVEKQFSENGLPAQKGYNVVIEGRVVDATNPTSVKKAIMMHTIEDKLGSSPFGFR